VAGLATPGSRSQREYIGIVWRPFRRESVRAPEFGVIADGSAIIVRLQVVLGPVLSANEGKIHPPSGPASVMEEEKRA